MRQGLRVGMLIGLATALMAASTAWAIYPPAIRDEGKFFTKEGLDKANLKIRELYEKYKKDVVVETLPALTADQAKKMDEDGKGKYFAKLARDTSVKMGLNGIYILVVKKPQHLQVHMDPDTQKKLFTAGDRKILIEKLIGQFKDDQFDAGLLEGLTAIEAALKANSANAAKK
ncbi:MAG: TPM domain-containing protein [Gemmataceae bacterium]